MIPVADLDDFPGTFQDVENIEEPEPEEELEKIN
jgi:hypothetical protein